MTTDIVSSILQWLNTHAEYSWLITFVISASESVAVIGTIVPGSITMTAIGALAGAGIIPLGTTIFWAFLGAIVGDGISYWLGYYFKDRLRQMWLLKKNIKLLEKGERFFNRYGGMGVFVGRFIGPIRALIPAVAGMMGMKPWRFIIANVASAAIWAPAYMLPGIVLGAASLELPPDIATRVMLILLFWTLFLLLCLWLIRKIPKMIHRQIIKFLSSIWLKLQNLRHGWIVNVILKHHNPAEISIQITLFFYFLLVCGIFACLASYVKLHGSDHIFVNQSVYHLFRGIYTDQGKNIMIFITLLGQKQIVIPVAGVIISWLFVTKRWHAALNGLVLLILAGCSVMLIKHNIQSARPWGVLEAPETFSFPSGHTTLTTVFYLGLVTLMGKMVGIKTRRLFYVLAGLLIIAVSGSRLYLGVHWFTDIIGAWLLSTALLILIAIFYNRYKDMPINVPKLLTVTAISLSLFYTAGAYYYVPKYETNLTKLDFPTEVTELNNWWKDQDNSFLPEWRVSLFGLPSQFINLEWLGDLSTIEKALIKSGWQAPPQRGWLDVVFRLSGIQSTEHLPLIAPFYLDKKPALVLIKKIPNEKILVLQLWPSNKIMAPHSKPIWLGVVGLVPRTYGWLSKHYKTDIEINANVLFNGSATGKETKVITVTLPNKKTVRVKKILLVK
jgi:membrane protein DedA with SNARE-associated domain/membrane-associated phospholipid phosphatase